MCAQSIDNAVHTKYTPVGPRTSWGEMADKGTASQVQARLECALTSYNKANGANIWHDRDQAYAVSVNGGMVLARVNGLGGVVSYKKFMAHIESELAPWKVDLTNRHFGIDHEPSFAVAVNTTWNTGKTNGCPIPSQQFQSPLPPSRFRLRNMGCCHLVLLGILLALLVQVLYALIAPLISGARLERMYK